MLPFSICCCGFYYCLARYAGAQAASDICNQRTINGLGVSESDDIG